LDVMDKVLLMQKEHGYFERDLEFICRLVENRPDDVKNIPAECRQRLQAYTKALKEHARVEMEDIFASMDKSRRCQKLIEGLTSPA
jgi:hemerythrin-like domain-containing protein